MIPVLIVEDDEHLCETLQLALSKVGREIQVVGNLSDAFHILAQAPFEIILLDRQLPDGDGLEFAYYVQETHANTKVIVMSKFTSANDRLKGLRSGADEYVAKPFALAEVVIRVDRLLHMTKLPRSDVYQIREHAFRLLPTGISLGDRPLALRKRELQILEFFLRHRNMLVTTEMLKRHIWPDQYELHPSTLHVYLRRLRQVLGPCGHLLQTVRNQGFILK